MGHKTIDVETIRTWTNTRLATPDSGLHLDGLTPEQAFRLGTASLLEQVLFNTGNYRGFGYLPSELLEGVLRPDHDGTRRRY